MNTKRTLAVCVVTLLALFNFHLSTAFAQGTAFTYQGRLDDGVNPAAGVYDLRFTLYDSASAGSVVGGPVTNSPTSISNGLFTVTLDFGDQFSSASRWLEIDVRTNGGGAFSTLSPRQALTATPYAVRALNANAAVTANTATTASSVAAANIFGTISVAQLPPSVITNGAAGVNFTGTFNGNGAALTNVNAARLTTYGVMAWGNNSEGQTTVPVAAQSGVVAIAGGGNHTAALKNDGSVLAWGWNGAGQTTVPVTAQSGVVDIAAGQQHTIALKTNGSVLAWGLNGSGQTTVPQGAQGGVVAIAAGDYHTVVLKNDGSVLAWGSSSYGETTVPVAAQSGVVAIAAGLGYTVALKTNGSVLAWGKNWFGETTVPVAAQSGVIAIAAGDYHTVALKTNGSVLEWGYFEHAQSVPGAAQSGVVAIAAGNDHTVALKNDGSVLAWGYISSPPVAAQSGVVAIAASGHHDVALVAQSVTWAKSANTFQADQALAGNTSLEFGAGIADKEINAGKIAYQLLSDGLDIVGAGTNDESRKINFFAESGATFTGPVTAPSFNGSFAGDGTGLTNLDASQVTSGTIPLAQLPANVALRAGGNSFTGDQIVTGGALYLHGGVSVRSAFPDYAAIAEFTDINGSAFRSFVGMDGIGLTGDTNQMYVGTYSSHPIRLFTANQPRVTIDTTGSVGIGTVNPAAKLDVIGNVQATQFQGGGGGLTGLNAANLIGTIGTSQLPAVPINLLVPPTGKALVVWGDNTFGHLNTPPTVLSGVIAAAAGTTHAIALKNDGSVVAWGGSNTYGQTTVPPAAQSGVTAIAAGEHHNLAVAAGSVVAWGANDAGESTVPLAAQSGVTNVAAGWGFSLALKNNGGVVVWGDNQAGQTIVPVAGQSGVVGISAGTWFCLALKTNGSVIAWGYGGSGETNLPASVQSGVTAISAGWYHALALKTNGSVVAWGYNASGQTNVPIAAQSGVVAIAADGHHSVALKSDGTIVEWGSLGGAPASAQGRASGIGAGPSVTMALVPPASIVPLLDNSNTFTGNQIVTNGSFVGSGSGLTGLNASQLTSGTIPLAQLPSSLVTNGANNVNLTGTFSGNGAGLTNFNATQLTSGTVADARLSSNIALRNAANNFTGGSNIFTGKVGIGTTNPAAPLQVQGAATWPVAPGAIIGIQTSGDAFSAGIVGRSQVPGAYGILGESHVLLTNVSGPGAANIGAGGNSSTTNGTGIYGNASAGSGLTYGVVGEAPSAQGYAGYFLGRGYFSGNVGIGITTPTNKLHVAGGVSATAFVSTSDRNAKENFTPVSPLEVLNKVTAIPITTWNFKDLKDGRHMGPMAQDFYAAFGLGSGDTTITSVDPDGVALAAIQGLNEKVEARSQKLETENAELKQRLERLERLMSEKHGAAK